MTRAALLAACAFVAAAERPPTPRFTDSARRAKLEAAFPEIVKLFETAQRQRGIPGLAFGIVVDGDVALMKTFGMRDRASNAPVTPDTVFRIASMTKSFTALAILRLRDEGRLSLDDPVSKWIPEVGRFDYPTRDAAPVRLRHLLTHTAGLPEDNPWGDRQLAIPDATMTRWLETGLPFSTSPGTAYEYSNYGFALLGRIVSEASGMPYESYLQKRILAPLGMNATILEPAAAPAGERAMGYRKSGDSYQEETSLAHGAFGAMGGLLTSSRDLGRYVAFQLSAWPPRDDEDPGPVRRSSRREMQTLWRAGDLNASRPAPDGQLRVVSGGYGYGLGVSRDCRFGHMVGHGGGLPGFGSYMLWLPEYGVGFFEMGNLTYSGLAPVIHDALDVLKKTGALQPRVLPPSQDLVATRDALVALWRDWDESRATALAADNLFLDKPAEQRKAEIQRLQSAVGACSGAGDVTPENLLRGWFPLRCERGTIKVTFTLAPTRPPKVQHLTFEMAKPLDSKMSAAARALADQIGKPSRKRLPASSFDPAAFLRQAAALQASYGSCRVGEALGGDGSTEARVSLQCDTAPLELRLRMDAAGKVTSATFAKPPGDACVP